MKLAIIYKSGKEYTYELDSAYDFDSYWSQAEQKLVQSGASLLWMFCPLAGGSKLFINLKEVESMYYERSTVSTPDPEGD